MERERRKRAELAKRKEEEALLREEQEAEAMPLSTWDLLSEPFKVGIALELKLFLSYSDALNFCRSLGAVRVLG